MAWDCDGTGCLSYSEMTFAAFGVGPSTLPQLWPILAPDFGLRYPQAEPCDMEPRRTVRTLQSQFLLRSSALNEIVGGVLGRAQAQIPVRCHALAMNEIGLEV
jgi:hypothetical protein